jgi:voltage-gated potassium channel
MVNDISIDKLRDHFIICGYGPVGRIVADQRTRLEIRFVLVETSESLCRELFKGKVLAIQGDATTFFRSLASNARGVCIVIDNDSDNL